MKNGENINPITGEARTGSILGYLSKNASMDTIQASKENSEAIKRIQSKLHTYKPPNPIEGEHQQMAPITEISSENRPMKLMKKELAVWDALILADQNRFKKEEELEKQVRKRKIQDMQRFNIQHHNNRMRKEKEDQQIDAEIGREFANRAQKANFDETEVEKGIKEKKKLEIKEFIVMGVKEKQERLRVQQAIE